MHLKDSLIQTIVRPGTHGFYIQTALWLVGCLQCSSRLRKQASMRTQSIAYSGLTDHWEFLPERMRTICIVPPCKGKGNLRL